MYKIGQTVNVKIRNLFRKSKIEKGVIIDIDEFETWDCLNTHLKIKLESGKEIVAIEQNYEPFLGGKYSVVK